MIFAVSRCVVVSSCTILTTLPHIFSTHLPLTDCLHGEMSLYFASSLDIITLTMLTPDDEAIAAVMEDQEETDTPDPMGLGDQIALRDAKEDDVIVVSVVLRLLSLVHRDRGPWLRSSVAIFCCGDDHPDDSFIFF